jgi:hypothetical protein
MHELFRLKEHLLVRGKNEWVATIDAYQCLVCEFHGQIPFRAIRPFSRGGQPPERSSARKVSPASLRPDRCLPKLDECRDALLDDLFTPLRFLL